MSLQSPILSIKEAPTDHDSQICNLNFMLFVFRLDLIFFIFYLFIIFTPLEFFTSVLADGFSLGSEWERVSSSLQDSSKDSGRSQQCSRLVSLYLFAKFQVLQALLIILQLLCQKHQSQLAQLSLSCSTAFSMLYQGRGTYPSFHTPSYLFCGPPGQQSRQFCKFSSFFFFCWL